MLRFIVAAALALPVAAQAQQTIKIGVLRTLSGQFADAAARMDNGIKQSYTMVTDYGPGIDAEQAFTSAFKAAGGNIVGSVRFPVANPDFSAFVQRAKDLSPESIFIFIPGGAQPAALGKAMAERGIDKKKTKVLGSGETTAEAALKAMGDAALDIITAWHYDYKLDNKLNQ